MTAWQSHPACWGSAHPNRLWLLVALLAGGEMCVCDLAAVTGMSESAASHACGGCGSSPALSGPTRSPP
jgi:hypothetical protein